LGVLLAAYGTLMEGECNTLPRHVRRALRLVGDCKIPGTLYDLGPYPGLILPSATATAMATVRGQLFRIAEDDHSAVPILAEIDRYEGFDPDAPEQSEFVRRHVRLRQPQRGAWLYVLNKHLARLRPIPSGDWRQHCRPTRSQ
jgi:gamma-glutamylcyclotransferase (GGCT)/AIG2-like uncharacterized protein YtfP